MLVSVCEASLARGRAACCVVVVVCCVVPGLGLYLKEHGVGGNHQLQLADTLGVFFGDESLCLGFDFGSYLPEVCVLVPHPLGRLVPEDTIL